MAESAYGFRKAEADCGVMSGGGEREASGQAVGVGVQSGQANLYKVK